MLRVVDFLASSSEADHASSASSCLCFRTSELSLQSLTAMEFPKQGTIDVT